MKIVFSAILVFYFTSTQAQKVIELIDNITFKPVTNVLVSNFDRSIVFGKTNEKGLLEIDLKQTSYYFSHPDYVSISFSLLKIQNSKFKVYISQAINTFDEIVVSASKFEEKKNDVSQKIQVLRAGEIAFQNQSSTADILANSGNVMVQKSQLGGGSPIIRGFETNKVLMVIDGIRMNNAIYRGGHLQNILTIDNAIMDRVEVVFGAGSVVYGSDALGGVMNFTTKNPILSSNNKIVIKVSAFSRYFSAAKGFANHADISIGNKRVGSLTSFTHSKFGDLRQGGLRRPFVGDFGSRPWYVTRINEIDSMVINQDSNVQVGSAYSQYDILQKFIFKQNDNIKHKLNFQLSNSGNIPRYDRLTQITDSIPSYSEWYYGPQFRFLASYSLEFNKKTSLYDQGKIILGYQNIEESRVFRKFKNDWENHNIEKLDIYTLNLDFAKKIKKHEIRYGTEAFLNKVNSKAFATNIIDFSVKQIGTRYPDGGSTMSSFAFYTTHAWEINDKLILNDGIRFSQVFLSAIFKDKTFFPFPFNSISQNNIAFNGNLGFVYLPAKTWRITTNLSTGFRAPNVDDLSKVFDSKEGTVIVPNPNLKSEYSYNAEVGISKEILPGFRASITSYYTKLTNAITIQNGLFNGTAFILYNDSLSQVKSSENVGEANIFGVEGSISGQINKFISIIGTINYTKGRIETDTIPYPLDHIPPTFGKFSIISSVNRLRVEFFVNYSAWKRIEDYNMIGEDNFEFALAEGMPSWYTLNTRINYNFKKGISFQISCENILDQNYRQFASNISAAGRNFILTLRGAF